MGNETAASALDGCPRLANHWYERVLFLGVAGMIAAPIAAFEVAAKGMRNVKRLTTVAAR